MDSLALFFLNILTSSMFKQMAINAKVLVLMSKPEMLTMLEMSAKKIMGTNIPSPIPMLRLLRRKNIIVMVNGEG
jgi:hypothetical protein